MYICITYFGVYPFCTQVVEIRQVLAEVERVVNTSGWNADPAVVTELTLQVEKAGEDFLS